MIYCILPVCLKCVFCISIAYHWLVTTFSIAYHVNIGVSPNQPNLNLSKIQISGIDLLE